MHRIDLRSCAYLLPGDQCCDSNAALLVDARKRKWSSRTPQPPRPTTVIQQLPNNCDNERYSHIFRLGSRIHFCTHIIFSSCSCCNIEAQRVRCSVEIAFSVSLPVVPKTHSVEYSSICARTQICLSGMAYVYSEMSFLTCWSFYSGCFF